VSDLQTLPDADAGVAAGRALRTAAVTGLGQALGGRVVDNDEVGAATGTNDVWLRRRTGVVERREALPGETTQSLSTAAGAAALADAGLTGTDLDLVVVGTCTPDNQVPHTAPLVAHDLGSAAGALDVGAACCGFLTALVHASAMVEAGRADRVLVVGADRVRSFCDPADKGTSMFADGAGAAVVEAGAGGGVVREALLGSAGQWGDLILAPPGGPLHVQGHETFVHATRMMAEASLQVLERAGASLDDVALVVPHQANSRIAQAVAERLGLPDGVVLDDIAEVGNTSAGTIPIALSRARASGRLPQDGLVLLTAFASGLVWGAALVDWRPTA
jgi:3-oxoacyl-[acyl-carrier-protein] synthase III